MMLQPRTRLVLIALLVAIGSLALFQPAARGNDRRTVVRQCRLLIGEAHRCYARGEVDSALAKLDEVLAADPANPDAHYFVGTIRLDQADTAGAEAILTAGVAKSPLSRRLKLLLARVKVAGGDPDGAATLVAEVTALRAHDLDAIYLQGLIALARGDSTTAASVWDAALMAQAEEAGP